MVVEPSLGRNDVDVKDIGSMEGYDGVVVGEQVTERVFEQGTGIFQIK